VHQSSYEKMRYFRDRYLVVQERTTHVVVDLGSADVNGTYRSLFDESGWSYVGLDLSPGKNVDVVLENPYRWTGIATNSVDVCVSGQALEHIPYFWLIVLEIERVLKPGGLCCLIAPSSGYEHRFPVDCWRFYPDGFEALARFARLTVEEVHTDWIPGTYTDDSAAWKDTVLVARKPTQGRLKRWSNGLRGSVLRRVTTM
jgi:SAM-dependent methyltransferase